VWLSDVLFCFGFLLGTGDDANNLNWGSSILSKGTTDAPTDGSYIHYY
jgi:hypothetical protein